MKQIPYCGDQRMLERCVFCAGPVETRDHIPSRILLDEPFPENLPVVPACKSCNQSFSADEEYVACLIECVLSGSCHPTSVAREKISRALESREALRTRIESQQREVGGETAFYMECDRVRNVILKLARGHAAFDLGNPQFDEPEHLSIFPMISLTNEQRSAFETPPPSSLIPEVGSRAMQRLFMNDE